LVELSLMVSLSDIENSLQKSGKFWIAFTGDSITSCEWVHPNWREIIEYVVKKKLTKELKGDWKTSEWGVRCFNSGYDGATTRDILGKIGDITLIGPDLTIGLMGGNDPRFNISVSEHVKNIEKITDNLISSGSKVVWCNSIPAGRGSKKNTEYEPYAEASMKIQEKENLQFVDMFNLYRKFPLGRIFTFKLEENPIEGIKEGEPDLQHPNQLGNAYIAQVILNEVFSLEFDPEKYIKDTLKGSKYPAY